MSSCCFPSAPRPSPSSPQECFQPELPFLSWSVSSDVQFSPQSLWETWSMSVSWDARLLCHVMSIYFLKNNPHSSDYEHNSNLKFLLLMMIIYIFFQFSSALLWKPFCFIVGFHFYGYAVCVLHVVLKHFRENKRSLSFLIFFSFLICLIPTVLSSWYPLGLTYSLPVNVAVIESRHGTTHCLNTVDHSRWSQETHPVEKNRPQSGATPQEAPHTPTGLNLQQLVFLFQWWTTFSLV